MNKNFKIYIPVEKRIIIHLNDYNRFKNHIEVDNAVTQQGIAKTTGIRQEHVSRKIKKLINQKCVFVRMAFVKEVCRHKKAYFLTAQGKKYAKEIRKWFDNKSIFIVNFENEIREIKFNQFNEHTNLKLKPLDLYRYSNQSENGLIDLKIIKMDR